MQASEEIQRLLPRLRDPAFNHVVFLTLAEATPHEEAQALEVNLARAGIGVEAWVVNQSLVPHIERSCFRGARIQWQ